MADNGYAPLHNDSIALDQTGRPPVPYSQVPMSAPNVVVQQPGYVTSTTTVITQQPQGKRAWQSDVCDCCDEISSCCCVLWCGTYYIGSMASRMGENCCVGCCLPGLWPMRSAFRERHNIQGDLCDDFCTTTFCGPCAACQLAREMNALGYEKNC